MDHELVVCRADSALRPFVRGYWGYHQRSAGPTRQREPLATGAVLIVGMGTQLGIVDPSAPSRPPARFGSLVAGLDDACTTIEHDGEMRGVQVDLTPLALRMLLGVPMHELARQVVALEDLLGPDARRLEERLMEAGTWQQRFALVESALAARLLVAEQPPADVDWAWRRLAGTAGRLRVADLAAELGCSRKHLAARFREHVGLPPKLVARMFRFRRASDLLTGSATDLAGLAAACGYYDQAHLDRDFRDFAGTTPTAYRSERAPFVLETAPAA